METENFSPKESLLLIEGMINKARNRFSEDGVLYLLWGWVILFCSSGHFVLLQLKLVPQPQLIWFTTWLAVIYQAIYLMRRKKTVTVVTYTDEIGKYVWVSFFIMGMLCGFILAKDSLFEKMYPVFLVLYGMPTFLSGIILRFGPLKIGGICCWALSVPATFVHMEYQLLLLGLAVICAWIIPGYQLRNKYKKINY